MFQFYLNRWVQREKQKNAKTKPNTKGENRESVRPPVTVCDAVRRSHPTLVCVCAKCEMRGHSLRTKTRTHCVTSVIKTTVNRTDAMVSHTTVQF